MHNVRILFVLSGIGKGKYMNKKIGLIININKHSRGWNYISKNDYGGSTSGGGRTKLLALYDSLKYIHKPWYIKNITINGCRIDSTEALSILGTWLNDTFRSNIKEALQTYE